MAKICPKGFTEDMVENPSSLFYLLYTQTLLSGRWKPIILDYLEDGPKRFSAIQRQLGNLSQGSLSKQLKELENDKLINRIVYPEVPPRVEYHLTDKGTAILPILEKMVAFGQEYQADIVIHSS
ncbi:winged helix-turn-helix transcriptional regulator [Streptococcus cameli]